MHALLREIGFGRRGIHVTSCPCFNTPWTQLATDASALHASPTISMPTTAAASQPVCLLPTAAAAQSVCTLKCEAPVDAARAPLELVAVLDRSHPMLKRSSLRSTAGTGSIATATATVMASEYSATLDRAIRNAIGAMYDIVDEETRAFWEEYLSLLQRERALTSAAGFSKASVALVKLCFKSSFSSLRFPCHVCLDDSVANVQAHVLEWLTKLHGESWSYDVSYVSEGRLLLSDCTLSSYDIRAGDTLHVIPSWWLASG